MKEHKGQFYAVDGESFAHGKVRDVTVTYEYDDIYDALFEALMVGDDKAQLDTDLYVDVGEFITEKEMNDLESRLEGLLDNDYGTPEHERVVSIFLDQHLSPSITYETEYQEYV